MDAPLPCQHGVAGQGAACFKAPSAGGSVAEEEVQALVALGVKAIGLDEARGIEHRRMVEGEHGGTGLDRLLPGHALAELGGLFAHPEEVGEGGMKAQRFQHMAIDGLPLRLMGRRHRGLPGAH